MSEYINKLGPDLEDEEDFDFFEEDIDFEDDFTSDDVEEIMDSETDIEFF